MDIKPHANMEGVDLRDADLRNQDLRCVRFYRTNLHRADLRGANLAGADLRWANLHDTKLDGANLEGARRGTQGGLDLQIPGWENDNGILRRKKTLHKLRVWGRDEKNTPHEEFDYSCDVSLAGDGYHMAVGYAINLRLAAAREDSRTKDTDLSLRLCITNNKDNP